MENNQNPNPVPLAHLAHMAEERTLLPEPFRGAPDQNASEFWRRLTTYMTYRELDPAGQLKLTKAMMVDTAAD